MTTTPDFRQHLEVETPEHVLLDYEIAGLGSRALAALVDTGILGLWGILLGVAFSLLATGLGECGSQRTCQQGSDKGKTQDHGCKR